MKTIKQHLDSARGNIRGDEPLLRRILSQIPEQKKPRHLISPYVTYALTTGVSVYMLFILVLPSYNNYVLYRGDNAIDKELMLIDLNVSAFEQNLDVQDVSGVEMI